MHTLELTNSKQDIQTAGKLLKDGELVAIPTETVYGLAADALNGEAVANIFKAKGRPMDNPLIVHIADLSQVDDLVAFVPPVLEDLAKAFWPGPLTVIMEKSDLIPDEVSAGLDTVAIRMPSHPDARAIIKAAGTPLAAPSANTSGMPSPTTAAHVLHDMDGKIAAVVDGGPCEVGVESTVLTLCTRVPRILRPGRVTPEDLFDVLGEVEVDDAVLGQLAEGAVAASPGMKYKHYSPKAEVYIVDGSAEGFAKYVNEKVVERAADEAAVATRSRSGPPKRLPLPPSSSTAKKTLSIASLCPSVPKTTPSARRSTCSTTCGEPMNWASRTFMSAAPRRKASASPS